MTELILIHDRYQLLHKMLGRGSSGVVMLALDTLTNAEVAVKLSHGASDAIHLSKEATVYEQIWHGTRSNDDFPTLLWRGYIANRYAIVWGLLGPTLDNLWSFCSNRLSIDTVRSLAQQIVSRLQALHERGYIHGSIKPQNMCMGASPPHKDTLYLIDYGCSAPINSSSPTTRATFFSIERHNGHPHDVCDDLESMFYTVLYLAGAKLPWCGLSRQQMAPIKAKHTVILAEHYGLKNLWLYIRSIAQSREKPDYAWICNELKPESKTQYDWFNKGNHRQ